jgi:RecB family exonuclease
VSAASAVQGGANPFWSASNAELSATQEQIGEVLAFRGWLARGSAAGQIALFEAPAAKLELVKKAAPANESALIPEVLSPSSLNRFSQCQVKWFYSKVLRLPEVRGAALALGSAVHDALLGNYRVKLDRGESMAVSDVVTLFGDFLNDQLEQCVLTADDDPQDLKDCGEVMVRMYMERVAPEVTPAAIEKKVEGLIGDVPVHGFIDLLDINGRVIDLKTASKKPSGVTAPYRQQVTTYAMLEPAANGEARLDTLTKTKTVAIHQTTFTVSDADRRLTERLYSISRDQMKSGLYLPNRDSYTCSRVYCSHWERCESEYGGQVKE